LVAPSSYLDRVDDPIVDVENIVRHFALRKKATRRIVPVTMLPFDNKNELLLVLDFDEGTTLERSAAAARDFESYLAGAPEVVDFIHLSLARRASVRTLVIRCGAVRAAVRSPTAAPTPPATA
jgi:multidrug efflux pump subunit AcrB